MTKAISKIQQLYVFLIPLSIILFSVFLAQSQQYLQNPSVLSTGIIADLLITVPFVYAVLIWKRDIPKFTILSMFVICLLIANVIIPENQQQILNPLTSWLVPIIEITVFSIVAFKVYQINRSLKDQKLEDIHFYDKIAMACNEALPAKISTLMATEISVIYTLIFGWKKNTLKENEFSNYKKSGIQLVLSVLIFLIIMETVAFHLLLMKWNPLVAWIIFGLSLYTCVQVFAMALSLKHHPVFLNKESKTLTLNYGFFSKAIIPFHLIDSIEMSAKTLTKDFKSFSPVDMLDSHNLIIHFKEEFEFHGFYGIKKKCKSLGIYIDEKQAFFEELLEGIQGTEILEDREMEMKN